jgi:hypothetical protein
VAHQSFQGVGRFCLTPFFFLVAYRLRIFDHLGKPVDRLTVCAGKKRVRSRFSPSRGNPPGNGLLRSMLFRAESSGNTTSLRGEGLGSDRTGSRNRLHGIPIYALYIAGGGLLPGRKRVVPYSIQTLKRLRPALFRQDLIALLDLLRTSCLKKEA